MRIIYIGLLGFVLSACSVSTPPVSEYRIITASNIAAFEQKTCKSESLKIGQAFSSSSLMSKDMKYAIGDYREYSFTQSQWSKTPNKAITDEIFKFMQATELFKNVQVSKSRSKNGMLLETNIEDFMQYFSEDKSTSFSLVTINLTLLDYRTSEVISTRKFTSKVTSKTIDAYGGVEALNTALTNTLNESGVWLSEVCK